jgi:extradiol dioxygenase family protein
MRTVCLLAVEHESLGAAKLRSREVKFVIEPYVRFEGQPGEQATMFFLDPRPERCGYGGPLKPQ